ncbi:unnamed protein product, partial [marine sediment metagenome]
FPLLFPFYSFAGGVFMDKLKEPIVIQKTYPVATVARMKYPFMPHALYLAQLPVF